MRKSAWLVLALAPLLAGGCGIQAGYEKLSHQAQEAVVVDGSLHIRGHVTPYVAPVEYGVKVFDAADDTGRQLAFKSFQRTFVKGMWFDLELSDPAPTAKTVAVDVAFVSGGKQHVKWELAIKRDGGDWFANLAWDEASPQIPRKDVKDGK